MKTYTLITIEHPDNLPPDYDLTGVLTSFINDFNANSDHQLSSVFVSPWALERKALVMALDRVLSEYPSDIEPEEVPELIEQEDESIIVWVNYDHLSPSDVVGEIYEMQASFLSDLIHFFKEGE